MKRKFSIVAVATLAVFLAVAAVTAKISTQSTPLYTVRMEQISSRMNFLPTAANGFTYIAEEGYNLNYPGCCGIIPTDIKPTNEQRPCEFTVDTCPLTCLDTCPNTCSTCSTCLVETCPSTCSPTCSGSTCGDPPC